MESFFIKNDRNGERGRETQRQRDIEAESQRESGTRKDETDKLIKESEET